MERLLVFGRVLAASNCFGLCSTAFSSCLKIDLFLDSGDGKVSLETSFRVLQFSQTVVPTSSTLCDSIAFNPKTNALRRTHYQNHAALSSYTSSRQFKKFVKHTGNKKLTKLVPNLRKCMAFKRSNNMLDNKCNEKICLYFRGVLSLFATDSRFVLFALKCKKTPTLTRAVVFNLSCAATHYSKPLTPRPPSKIRTNQM